jgi:hypothetical protein
MNRKKILWIVILALCLLPVFGVQAQDSSAGFVPGNIWYSPNPFEEGDKIKIYTVLFNPDAREFSGTVIFFDKTTFLGKKDFKVEPRSVQDISIDWTVNIGEHVIFAKIENAKFLLSTGKYEEVYLSGNQTEESIRNIKKKIVSSSGENIVDNLKAEIVNTGSSSIANISKLVKEETPSIIANPIIGVINSLEELRGNIGNSSQDNKDEIRRDLKENTEEKESKLATPFKYVKLFFFALVSLIFNQKIIFYLLLGVITFYILRYIWRLVF